MSTANEQAISSGRCISRKESVRVNASCSIPARYQAGDCWAYLCQGKRVSMAELVSIANELRRSVELPPFSPRVAILHAGAKPIDLLSGTDLPGT